MSDLGATKRTGLCPKWYLTTIIRRSCCEKREESWTFTINTNAIDLLKILEYSDVGTFPRELSCALLLVGSGIRPGIALLQKYEGETSAAEALKLEPTGLVSFGLNG